MGGEDVVRQQLEAHHKTDELLAKSLVSKKPAKTRRGDGHKYDSRQKKGNFLSIVQSTYLFLSSSTQTTKVGVKVALQVSQKIREAFGHQGRPLQEGSKGWQVLQEQEQVWEGEGPVL